MGTPGRAWSSAGDAEEQRDDRDAAAPRGANFRPDVRTFERPWSEEYNELVSAFEEVEDVFFEVGAGVDFGLIEERRRASG